MTQVEIYQDMAVHANSHGKVVSLIQRRIQELQDNSGETAEIHSL